MSADLMSRKKSEEWRVRYQESDYRRQGYRFISREGYYTTHQKQSSRKFAKKVKQKLDQCEKRIGGNKG